MPDAKKKVSKESVQDVRTWVEVDKKALESNYTAVRAMLKEHCRLMAVAKSNAYGHGLIDYTREMEKLGADWFGVDSITEALALRRSGIQKPILVLGYTLSSRLWEAAKHDIRISVSSPDSLKDFIRHAASSRLPKIHLKIDSGMHRQGFMVSEISAAASALKKKFKNSGIVEGAFTHFAAAKNPAFPSETLTQTREYEKAIKILSSAGFSVLKHAAATGGMLVFPDTHFNMVRVGIGLYGLWPSQETNAVFSDALKLKPALSWKTVISEVKALPAGSRIGYDFTEMLRRDSRVAICPIGYWHGYPRALSGAGHVLVRGNRARVLGRVSMDMLSIDVTGIKNTMVGEEVTLIGRDGKEEVSADELGYLTGTTNYEIITRLNPLMKRVYV
ncbi:MAG: alanine racemase [bacterium]|nr:alanine racemase [bacterium]